MHANVCVVCVCARVCGHREQHFDVQAEMVNTHRVVSECGIARDSATLVDDNTGVAQVSKVPVPARGTYTDRQPCTKSTCICGDLIHVRVESVSSEPHLKHHVKTWRVYDHAACILVCICNRNHNHNEPRSQHPVLMGQGWCVVKLHL